MNRKTGSVRRRHRRMYRADRVLTLIFRSTITLLNPMGPSSQGMVPMLTLKLQGLVQAGDQHGHLAFQCKHVNHTVSGRSHQIQKGTCTSKN